MTDQCGKMGVGPAAAQPRPLGGRAKGATYMRTIVSEIVLSIFLVNGPILYAQSFYPLKVGNQWVYRDTSWGYQSPSTADTTFVEVVGDTIMPNGQRYFSLKGNEAVGAAFVRADPDTIHYYNLFDSTDQPIYRLWDTLHAQWSVNFGPFFAVSLATRGPYTWFGAQTDYRQYRLDGLALSWVVLTDKFGPVMVWDEYDPPGIYNTRRFLIGAMISDTAYGILTGVAPPVQVPSQYSLSQNYPNPFNPGTLIRVTVPHKTSGSVVLYDVIGRRITTLFQGTFQPGITSIRWDARSFAAGVYFYRLQTPEYSSTKSMVLLK